MTTVSRNKARSKSKKNKDNQIDMDDRIDEIMKNITLKRPRNPYTQFVLNEIDQMKSKNKDLKISIQELSQQCPEKWKKLKSNKIYIIYKYEKNKRQFLKINLIKNLKLNEKKIIKIMKNI